MPDTWRLDAAAIAARVRARALTATQVARDALDRLERANPALNAVVEHRPEHVLARAAAVDAQLARGEDPGPLAGVPVTIKCNTDQAGFPTTNGLLSQAGLVAAHDGPVVRNLLRAGAVPLGRTNTPAFSYRWFTDNRLHGRTINPRDPALTPGGSSGGAASAVAAGIGPLAHGTDIAGSIRYPAYACGVHGLRPTPGRVAAFNASGPERGIAPQLSAVSGPLARSVADLRLALAAMSAPDPDDPWWTPAPLEGPPVPLRAALCLRPAGLDTHPLLQDALREAAERLRAAGWTVEELPDLPPLREAADVQTRLWLGDGYDAQLAAAEREGDPGALAVLRGHEALARATDGDAYRAALARRATLAREWSRFLAGRPVVLLPPSAALPFPVDEDLRALPAVWEAQIPQVAVPALGLPGLCLATAPSGRTPLGVQILAPRFREDLCLLAAEAIERPGALSLAD